MTRAYRPALPGQRSARHSSHFLPYFYSAILDFVEYRLHKILRQANELKDLRPIYFLFLTVAGVVNAIGVTMFLYPVKLYDSGISGTSMLLDQITPDHYELSMFLLLLNIPIFLFGMKKQGLLFTGYSIFTIGVYS